MFWKKKPVPKETLFGKPVSELDFSIETIIPPANNPPIDPVYAVRINTKGKEDYKYLEGERSTHPHQYSLVSRICHPTLDSAQRALTQVKSHMLARDNAVLAHGDPTLEESQSSLLTVREFFEKGYVHHNSLVRLWFELDRGQHKTVTGDLKEVAHAFEIKRGSGPYRSYLDHRIINIIQIDIAGSYSSAVNIVIESKAKPDYQAVGQG